MARQRFSGGPCFLKPKSPSTPYPHRALHRPSHPQLLCQRAFRWASLLSQRVHPSALLHSQSLTSFASISPCLSPTFAHVEDIEEDDVKSLADEVLAEYRQALQEVFGNSERVTDVLEDVKLWTIGK